ncbi:integrase [Enterobacter roggenkampii]|uniref:integrase n=2 Tax=Enterobacteriaceae TaxID=543 RepID=UPI003D6FB540
MLRIGQVEATATQDGKYTDGSVAGGIAATRLRAAAFNAMQEELAHIVESAGLALDINDMTQVLKAIQKLTLSRINPFADIKSDGAAAISTALANLRLGAGAPAIGIPFFWPSAAMPNTVMDEWSDMVFLKWNGATFSATEYPKLALVIPGLRLNDVRGEFIRVWDDGRGVDIGRALLSAQESSKLHEHLGQNGSAPNYGYMTVANPDSVAWDNGWSVGNIPNFSSGSAGSNLMGMRPRNVAFNFLVRAK